MSNKSFLYGRAYEYACLMVLGEEIAKHRPVAVVRNSSVEVGLGTWNAIPAGLQTVYRKGAAVAARKIFELEPRILENDGHELTLTLQPDRNGQDGDVRDLIISRGSIKWEIGLSLKHNNFAVKHSRLSGTLDFGEKWYGVPCSRQYWDDVRPIFARLTEEKARGTLFRDMPDKAEAVYKPLLAAFIAEVNRQSQQHKEIAARLVEYMFGVYDFYKVVSIDNENQSQIQSFNLHGMLGKAGKKGRSRFVLPIVDLPKRIISLDFVPGSTNTAILCLDGGWQFSLRIHSASTKVESSMKFDIQVVGTPRTIITINCYWT